MRKKSINSEKKKKPKLLFLFRFFLKIGLLTLIVWFILTYILGLYRMTGNNMFSSIKDGDLCILYKIEDYYTNDIVSYITPDGQSHIGRIVAVPGQTVDFPKEGGYLVNGYQLSEEITYQTFASEKSAVKYPLSLNEDEYFILNDFRSDTKDSREYGTISRKEIGGKLIFLLRRRSF